MRQRALPVIIAAIISVSASAQVDERKLKSIFEQQIETADVWSFAQLQYALERAPTMPSPSSAAQWTRESENLREHVLNNVVFHGWPKEVVEAKPVFEDVGMIPSGKGYRIRKLRYEVVPGLWSVALLYEPEGLTGKVPAVISVLGHFYGKGKAMNFNQELCINYALRGMLAVTPEWLDMGELNSPESSHLDFEAHIDFVGANPVGLFYLAMRRVLDYLYIHANVDKSRIGVTGVSGGGWQTITLSALDLRVYTSIPVAGFQSVISSLDYMSSPGRLDSNTDMEQGPTDLFTILDNATLAAMRAPRPTLEIYNGEDDCCFRAPFVKRYVFDAVEPFFNLYGKGSFLEFHENRDPGTHNYELDNREASYHFFDKHFSLSVSDREIPVQTELKTYEDLEVGLPEGNLTLLGLARSLAAKINHPPIPQDLTEHMAWATIERTKLKNVVRYNPLKMKHPWAVATAKEKGLESIAYRFQLSDTLSATGVWVRQIPTATSAPITIVLDDQGKQVAITERTHTGPVVSDLLERGNQVLVLDLLFTPISSKARPQMAWSYSQLLSALGDRPLGIEAAQLIGVAEWASSVSGSKRVDLVSYGIRDQVIALVASAVRPDLFTKIDIRGGMKSLSYLLDAPVTDTEAPDLFCQDLYKEFDIEQLVALAGSERIHQELSAAATK